MGEAAYVVPGASSRFAGATTGGAQGVLEAVLVVVDLQEEVAHFGLEVLVVVFVPFLFTPFYFFGL